VSLPYPSDAGGESPHTINELSCIRRESCKYISLRLKVAAPACSLFIPLNPTRLTCSVAVQKPRTRNTKATPNPM